MTTSCLTKSGQHLNERDINNKCFSPGNVSKWNVVKSKSDTILSKDFNELSDGLGNNLSVKVFSINKLFCSICNMVVGDKRSIDMSC